eukprot:7296629-Lingulodinium_polyedra.AAC.1
MVAADTGRGFGGGQEDKRPQAPSSRPSTRASAGMPAEGPWVRSSTLQALWRRLETSRSSPPK